MSASAIFILHVKRRRLGPEVNDLCWWVELNFGQEPKFLEEPGEVVF